MNVADLEVGDVVVSLETTTFVEPVTITRRNDYAVYNDAGGFWPLATLGRRRVQVLCRHSNEEGNDDDEG